MADQPKPPLWQAMDAAVASRPTDDLYESPGADYAAEIRALADWLVPEEVLPTVEDDCPRCDENLYHAVLQRQMIRRRLLAEADRAERGE